MVASILPSGVPYNIFPTASYHPPATGVFYDDLPESPQTNYAVRDFINGLEWDEKECEYRNIVWNEAEFLSLLDKNNEQFKLPHNPAKDYGTIAKKDLGPQTRIYVRADLHGDLKSLVTNLIALRNEGVLDPNFKCKPNTVLVILGDFMDRGDYVLQVAKLLMLLRFENENQVLLIRGNHEHTNLNWRYNNNKNPIQKIIHSPVNCEKLEKFYETLYLAVYLAEKCEGKKYYSCFPHAFVELSTDTSSILDSSLDFDRMTIPKIDRVKKRIIDIAELEQNMDFQCEYVTSTIETLKKKLQEAKPKTEEKKALKLKLAATVIAKLDHEYQYRKDGQVTVYNWGIFAMINRPTEMREPGLKLWKITIEDAKHAFRLQSVKNKVAMMWRGHDHYPRIDAYKNKALIYTLPIGSNSDPHSSGGVDDHFVILQTAPHINDWTRQKFIRRATESVMKKCPQVKARNPEIEIPDFTKSPAIENRPA